MTNIKLTYKDLKKKLADAEKLISKLRKNKTSEDKDNAVGSEIDVSLLSSKELAEAYIASEQNFKNTVDSSPLGIRVVTEESVLIYANKAALNIFGYPSVEELAAVKKSELYTPESYAAHQERKRKRKLKEYVPGEYEISIKRPDGQIRNLLVYHRGVIWGGEQQFMAMYQDITDQKKAEEALRDSEEKYHTLIEHSNDGIVYIQDGTIQYCNSKTLEISGGYTPEEIIGKPFINFVAPEHVKMVSEMYRKRMAGEKTPERYELNILSKSGTVVYTEISASLFTYKQKFVDIAIIRDITERKQTLGALQESEEKFSKAFYNSPSLMAISTIKDGRIVEVNDIYCQVTGYSREELIGRTTSELNLWHDPKQRQAIVDALNKEGIVTDFEVQMHSKSGEIQTISLSTSKIMLKNEPCLLTIAADITERKRAEEALRESEREKAAILNGVSELVTYQDRELKLIWANRAAGESVGISPEKLLGRHCYEIWHNRSEPCVGCPVVKSFETGKPQQAEMSTPDGRTWFVRGYPVRDEKGSVIGVTEITLEISERKQAEEALRKQQVFLSNILSSIKDGISVLDNDYNIVRTNKAMEEWYSHAMPIVGKKCYEAYQGRTDVCELCPTRKTLKTHQAAYEVVPITGEGGVITGWRDLYSFPLIDAQTGEMTGVIEYVRDITERRHAEEALKESEERYRLLFENSNDAILLTQSDGTILAANPAACRMLGRSEEEICRIGRSGVIDTTDPRLEPALEQRRTTGEFSGELTLIRADGSKFPGDVSTRIFYDKDGKEKTSMIIRDITERREMEDQMERDREEIKLIIDSTPILVFYKDIEGRFLRVNKALAESLNIPEEDCVWKTVFDLFSKDIAQGMTDDDNEVFKSGRSKLNIIEQYESASGLRWVQTDKMPIFDDNNKVIGLVGFAQDITERKAAEEALRESEERFNKAFHASPNLMAVLTMEEGRFIDVNAEHTRITGYERPEVIGKTTLELNLWVNPERRKLFYSIINTEGRLKNFEALMRTKSGEIRTLLFSAEKIMLRGIPSLVVVALDITERKEAEERINHLNLTLRAIRDVDQLITQEKDRDLLIKSVCDSLVISRSFNSAWIVLLDENQQPVAWAEANMSSEFPALIESMRQGEMPPCVVKALKQKHVVITEDPHRMCQGCLALTRDSDVGSMTIRLEIEEKIYGVLCTSIPKSLINDKNEISLFTEVATDIAFALRDIDLVAANEKLVEEQLRMAKLESIGMLAGGIAHDFNNLLTGIMGNIGLVKSYISPSDNTYEMLDEAERAAIRARDLTQQLLTFARGGKPVKKPVNVYELMKESSEFALRGSKAKLLLSLPEDLWQIDADEGQISQVINNLVINADEAMPMGGTLKIHAENEAIRKNSSILLKSGSYVRIDIEDTGTGISPEHLQRIFEPYFTTKQRGSGLGLTTAYSVVRNHGGIMTAESELKKGSTFRIYLPASKRAVKGGKKLTVTDSGQAGGKVLIMDDEEIIRKMLTNMLGMAGYTVEVSADGVEALEKYQQAREAGDPFNAVIMDLTVPGGMGGKEAVKKILEIDPKAVVIVSSGYATDPIMSDFKKYGFKAVIAKPYSVRQLRESLSSLLTKKKKKR